MSIPALPTIRETFTISCQEAGKQMKKACFMLCDRSEWLNRKLIRLTEHVCHGDQCLASVTRVAIKTLASLSLLLISPLGTFPTVVLLGLGQTLLARGKLKPWYSVSALITKIFVESTTLSNPIINAIVPRYSFLSLVLHGVATMILGTQLEKNLLKQNWHEQQAAALAV